MPHTYRVNRQVTHESFFNKHEQADGRRSEEGVQRILLRYDRVGRIERLTWERFTKSR